MHDSIASLFRFSAIVAIFSVLLNGLLLAAIWARSPENRHVRALNCLFVAIDLATSVATVMNIPIFASSRGIVVLFPARLGDATSLNWFLFCWIAGQDLISPCVNLTKFLYRYALVCSPRLFDFLSNPAVISMEIAFGSLLLLSFVVVTAWMFSPTPQLAEIVSELFNEVYELDFAHSVFLGAETTKILSHPSQIFFGAVTVLTVASQLAAILFFAWRIHLAVKSIKSNDYTVQLHRRILRMLCVQTLIPVILMYIPILIVAAATLFTLDTVGYSIYLSYLVACFPLANGISSIYYVKEYRSFILLLLLKPLMRIAGPVDLMSVATPSTRHVTFNRSANVLDLKPPSPCRSPSPKPHALNIVSVQVQIVRKNTARF